MAKKDYYEVLGVNKSATQDEIKSSFRKLAKQYHPDVCKEENAEAKFKEIQEAYAVLSDENRRKQYDQFGHAAFDNQAGGGFNGAGFDFGNFDFSDIFENIFGDMGGFSRSGGSQRRGQKGEDSLVRMRLTFEEAIFGCDKDIDISLVDYCDNCNGVGGFKEKTCSKCHGSGTVTAEQRTLFGSFITKTSCPTCGGTGNTYQEVCEKCHGKGKVKTEKTYTVNIPSGVVTGNRLRLAGKGEAGSVGGKNGDIYIEFIVDSHEYFERIDDDIYLNVPLTITEAVLGAKKEIPTITGNITLSVPMGTQNADKQRIKGKGVDNKTNYHKGDMYIVYNIIIPSKLSRDQKQLFEKLSTTDLDDQLINKFNKFVKNNKN